MTRMHGYHPGNDSTTTRSTCIREDTDEHRTSSDDIHNQKTYPLLGDKASAWREPRAGAFVS
jgi:hypothetical protein